MGSTLLSLFLVFFIVFRNVVAQVNLLQAERCKSPSTAPQRIEKVISSCQDEIKLAILQEALDILGETTKEVSKGTNHRSKRETFSDEEKRIAGCLLQCVYKRVNALDQQGVPTVEGLVRLYADGITERGYFLATAQAVQQCLYASRQHQLSLAYQGTGPDGGEMCDLAYNVFDCVSDQIANYCRGF